ncbi:MAG: hypothetical protein JO112_20025 [Planctomycetes bacterium]|nr:hypothetical protein [Planctomycetota bacterium]
MRIGYLFRGFLGDIKLDANGDEVSTPDGNATYSWSIEHECNRRGYKLIPLGPNLDAPAASKEGLGIFDSFSWARRSPSYIRMMQRGWTHLSDRKLPELDLVLVEWRWPIPGRNTPDDRGTPGYQNDLERQREVLLHYSDLGVPIVVWDLDHKLTEEDREVWSLAGVGFHVIETSARPRPGAVRVEPPTVVDDLLQFDIDERQSSWHLGYIGSRYERDQTIDKWIAPIAVPNGHRVKFWGKWEPAAEVRERWPGVDFGSRIGVRGFRDAYSRVSLVPLLAKQSYYECGFVTPRIWEAILFGSIPVGLSEHHGIGQYVDRVADSPEGLFALAREMRTISPLRRRILREEAAHRLSHMDVRHFVDVLERLAGTVDGAVNDSGGQKDREDGKD